MARISSRRSATPEDINIGDIDLEMNEGNYTKFSGKMFPDIGIVHSRIGHMFHLFVEILRMESTQAGCGGIGNPARRRRRPDFLDFGLKIRVSDSD